MFNNAWVENMDSCNIVVVMENFNKSGEEHLKVS